MPLKTRPIPILAASLIATAGGCVAAPPPGLPASDIALRVQGADLVNDEGEPVALRAINLGNWLLLEMWMLAGQPLPDQRTFFDVLEARFGEAEAERLIDLYRTNWITQRDMDLIAAAGFNAVRLPFSHLVVESAPFVFDEEGFGHLRRAIDMADTAGLFVILDMHQVPGGQSFDQPSGDTTENGLWTDPQAQERLAWLWQNIARRVKNDRNVVAYDLINEPYSTFNDDIRPQLLSIVDKTIGAIREVDADRLIYAPGPVQGIGFYGDPADRGWTNTGFTEHFYPGIFDYREPTMGNYARFLAGQLRGQASYARSLDAPYLWGEFNPVFESQGSEGAVRDAFDTSEEIGFSSAIWSYKIISAQGGAGDNNWYLVTNATPFAVPDIRTASKAAIETAFESLGTATLAIDQGYFNAMSALVADRTLPVVPLPPLAAPAHDDWTTWTATDIGAANIEGGQSVAPGASPIAADALEIYTSGNDLFNSSDSVRLVTRVAPPTFAVSGVLHAFEGGEYAQGGVTIRANENPNATHLSLVVFGDGRLLVKSRAFAGTSTSQRFIANVGFPVGLTIEKTNGGLTAWHTNENGDWQSIPLSENPSLGSSPRAGFFGASNRDTPLSVFRFDGPRLDQPGVFTAFPDLDANTNRLANGSFESGGSLPASWQTFGSQFTRQTGWVPVREGSSLLAYRHWEAGGNGEQGAYQDITGLTPGEAYVFTVYANRDTVAPGRALADEVRLRVEEVGSPIRVNETAIYPVADIATNTRWSRLQVRFIATRSTHRVVIAATPGSGNRDGAVKFDGVHLEAESP